MRARLAAPGSPPRRPSSSSLRRRSSRPPSPKRIEVGRVTAEVVQGIVIGGLLTPLGLTHTICAYAWPRGARSSLAVIIRKREGRPAQLGDVDAARVQAWMHAMAAADLALSTMRARCVDGS